MMWVPFDAKDPILWHGPTHKQIGMFLAFRLKNGPLVAQQWDEFNSETFGEFLKQTPLSPSPLEEEDGDRFG